MKNIRHIRYRNFYGKEIYFDNKKYFAEEIQIGGTSARYNSLRLFDSPGAVTDDYGYDVMPIHIRFALLDKSDNRDNRDLAGSLFASVKPGILTVYTDDDEYSIELHLTQTPVFNKVNTHVWRWEADFIADYPFFQKGRLPNRKTIESYTTIVYNTSPVPVPVKIRFYKDTPFKNQTSGKGFSVSLPQGADWIEVDTKNFNITDSSGNNANNCVSIYDEIDEVMLLPGKNEIFCPTYSSGGNNNTLEWWELRGAVF